MKVRSSYKEVLYMHMADALLAPAVAATMYVASGAMTGVSVKALKKDENMNTKRKTHLNPSVFVVLTDLLQTIIPLTQIIDY